MQEHMDVPDYQILLNFNLCAQAAEASSDKKKNVLLANLAKQVTSFASNTTPTDSIYISCKSENHPLSKFRCLSHWQDWLIEVEQPLPELMAFC